MYVKCIKGVHFKCNVCYLLEICIMAVFYFNNIMLLTQEKSSKQKTAS